MAEKPRWIGILGGISLALVIRSFIVFSIVLFGLDKWFGRFSEYCFLSLQWSWFLAGISGLTAGMKGSFLGKISIAVVVVLLVVHITTDECRAFLSLSRD